MLYIHNHKNTLFLITLTYFMLMWYTQTYRVTGVKAELEPGFNLEKTDGKRVRHGEKTIKWSWWDEERHLFVLRTGREKERESSGWGKGHPYLFSLPAARCVCLCTHYFSSLESFLETEDSRCFREDLSFLFSYKLFIQYLLNQRLTTLILKWFLTPTHREMSLQFTAIP